MMKYRIREGIFTFCDGYSCVKARGYIAESQRSFFGLFSFWWPVTGGFIPEFGGGRLKPDECLIDIEHDKAMRAPLSKPMVIE